MKLLADQASNTKLAKSGNKEVRIKGLSLYPDNVICPGAKAAGCMLDCLKGAGRGVFPNVKQGRLNKADLWHQDKDAFLAILRKELSNFVKLSQRKGFKPVVRLNVLSDIAWEQYNIPQDYPEIEFYDYSKRAARLGKLPSNYKIIFSYSGKPEYQKQNEKALATDYPVAVVFRDKLPIMFAGREVIDGDKDDLANATAYGKIVGLIAKGPAKTNDNGFVID